MTTVVRMLADDRTGALDAGARLARVAGPFDVIWRPDQLPAERSGALDTGTRVAPWREAAERVAAAFDWLAAGTLAFKKVDSLLRANTLQEIAWCASLDRFRTVVVAPAFPEQNRITRGGVQWVRDGAQDPWAAVGQPIDRALAALGVRATVARSDALPRGRVIVFDAQTSADLAAIAAGRFEEPVLWCGSAGLAQALAGGTLAFEVRTLRPPVLAIVGSRHRASQAQIERIAVHRPGSVHEFDPSPTAWQAAIEPIRARLVNEGFAVLRPLPRSVSGPRVREELRDALSRILPALSSPSTVIASGGDTLAALCDVVEARSLSIAGEIGAGLPVSHLCGGRWTGTAVVSKSGAFGGPGTLAGIVDAMLDSTAIA